MKPRNTAILAVLVAALGAFLWFYEIGGEAQRERAAEAGKRVFPDVEQSQISSFELRTTDGKTARVARADGGWRLEKPVAFRADTLTADAVAAALAEMSADAVFDHPEPLANYGLEGEPTVTFEAGGKSHALRVGHKTPVGGNTYVTDADGEKVYAVKTFRTNALEKSVDQLRDAKVLDFDRAAVQAVSLAWPGGSVELERADEGWKMKAPLVVKADGEAVEGLLSDLQYLRAEGFVDHPPPDAELGLDAPELRVDLQIEGRDEPLHFAVGATQDGKTRAVRGRDGHVYEIATARLDDFPRDVFAYRDKQLARFSAPDAASFELVFRDDASGKDVVETGKKVGDDWVVAPDAMAPGLSSRMVSELSRLDAAGVAAEAAGDSELAALGLAPPRAELRVRGASEDAQPLADLSLGKLEPGKGIAAQRPGDTTVYWAPEALAEHVPIGLDAWHNRFASKEAAPPEPSGGEPGEGEASSAAPLPD